MTNEEVLRLENLALRRKIVELEMTLRSLKSISQECYIKCAGCGSSMHGTKVRLRGGIKEETRRASFELIAADHCSKCKAQKKGVLTQT